MRRYFEIVVDNAGARSHNINIDRPSYGVLASNEDEAVGKMVRSGWTYASMPIVQIVEF